MSEALRSLLAEFVVQVDKAGEKLFLPFEGDRVLSVILSKAFLLAADDKITDATILRQLS